MKEVSLRILISISASAAIMLTFYLLILLLTALTGQAVKEIKVFMFMIVGFLFFFGYIFLNLK